MHRCLYCMKFSTIEQDNRPIGICNSNINKELYITNIKPILFCEDLTFECKETFQDFYNMKVSNVNF